MDSWSRDCHLRRARIHGTFDIFRSIRMCQTRRGIDWDGSQKCKKWRSSSRDRRLRPRGFSSQKSDMRRCGFAQTPHAELHRLTRIHPCATNSGDLLLFLGMNYRNFGTSGAQVEKIKPCAN